MSDMTGGLLIAFLTAMLFWQMRLFWKWPLIRSGRLFGVRVRPEFFSAQGPTMLRRYRLWLTVVCLATIASVIFLKITLGSKTRLLTLITLEDLFLSVYFIAISSFFRRKVRAFRVVEKAVPVALSLKPRRLSDYISLRFELAMAFAIITAFLLMIQNYPQLPDRLIAHVDWDGKVDEWLPKSFKAVFQWPIFWVYFQAGMMLLKYSLVKAPLRIPVEGADQYLGHREKQLRLLMDFIDQTRTVWSLLLIAMANDIRVLAQVHITFLSAFNVALSVSFWAILLGLQLAVLFYYVDRSRAIRKEFEVETDLPRVSRSVGDARFFFGGLFYYDPDDPGILIEGPRWSALNLANKRAYLYAAYLTGFAWLMIWPFTNF